ncbi:MAG: hypothetical protein ACI97A_001575 [Planctomycetota bacterium]|jgi:hypothetical protein
MNSPMLLKSLLLVSVLVLNGCANKPDWRADRTEKEVTRSTETPRVQAMDPAGQDSKRPSRKLILGGPDFLSFPRIDDAVVARVGDEELHKSQVFDAMAQSQPEQVRATIAVLLGNRVLASECAKFGISVDGREIDAWFATHKNLMLQKAVLDYGKGTDFRTWVRLRFGQSLTDYERISCDRERAKRLLGRLIRFHQLLEDRVQMRIISTTTREKANSVHKLAKAGADFATLAEQHSVHPSAEAGGLMPPVWRASLNPALDRTAFELPVGVVSDIVQAKDQSLRDRFQIIKVIRRFPGKKVRYSNVEDEIIAGLTTNQLSQDEWYMWQLKLEKLAEMSVEDF